MFDFDVESQPKCIAADFAYSSLIGCQNGCAWRCSQIKAWVSMKPYTIVGEHVVVGRMGAPSLEYNSLCGVDRVAQENAFRFMLASEVKVTKWMG
ncbi:MAG: hypothetical protein KatS3mg049_3087 [Caldilinea sp.]|nr:MAG: hypothetical protein KatS3mg049_3087 [Caldilinea sp.]